MLLFYSIINRKFKRKGCYDGRERQNVYLKGKNSHIKWNIKINCESNTLLLWTVKQQGIV